MWNTKVSSNTPHYISRGIAKNVLKLHKVLRKQSAHVPHAEALLTKPSYVLVTHVRSYCL